METEGDVTHGLIRGTTPTLEFALPFQTNQLAEAFVTISQRGAVVIDKPLTECECDAKMLTVRLTQAETLRLQSSCICEIQIRARTLDGEAVASNIMSVQTERILKDGVI